MWCINLASGDILVNRKWRQYYEVDESDSEEDEDLGLVVDQIASLPLVKRQTARLSLRFLLLLLIHKYNQGSIKNKHKLVISKIASTYFDLIHNQMPQDCAIDFSKKPDEASANLLFVLSGFFGEYFAKFFDQYTEYEQVKQSHIKYIEAGLKEDRADEWVSEGLVMLKYFFYPEIFPQILCEPRPYMRILEDIHGRHINRI